MRRETFLLHTLPSDPLTGSVSVPIYQTSTFAQEAPGVHKGYDYARTANPTRKALESLLVNLESPTSQRDVAGFAFASGLAAVDCVLKLLVAGDEVLAVDDVYGGTFRLFERVYKDFGITFRYVDMTKAENIGAAITERTKLVWIETPTNPTLKITDIREACRIAHRHKVLVVVDNTFASPELQRPLECGADIVLHSATKYLGGHSDLIAGCLVVRGEELCERIKFLQNACGAILGPFDAWLTIRGITTLGLRVRRQSESALRIARCLQRCPQIKHVNYPGLPQHTNHEVAFQQQNGGFGGVISFSLQEDTLEAATRVVTSTKIFTLAESLGGAKSLVCHPAAMTHKSIPAANRHRAGVSDSLIRLSIGLEDPRDLMEDLTNALRNALPQDLSDSLESPVELRVGNL